MGIGLVLAAYDAAERLGLDHAPTRVFVYMAAVALDADQRPAYWKGREALAHALGSAGANGHRAATRALASLTTAGAVERTGAPAPGGHNARYTLLDGHGAPLRPIRNAGRSAAHDQPETQDAQPPTNAGRSAPNAGRSAVLTRDAQPPTEEEQEKQEEGVHESTPARTCTTHPSWDHDKPCRRCGADRKAAELHEAAIDAERQRVKATRPPRLVEVTAYERTLIDSAVRGLGTVADRLQPALAEARREREEITA